MTTVSRTALFVGALLMSGAAFAQAPAAPPAAAPAAPAAAAPAAPARPAAAPIVVKDAGLAGATSVRYDLYYDRYLVATSAGVVSITGDGKIDNAKFIATGLDKPVGVYVRDAQIFVLDSKGVKVFDLTGKQVKSIDVTGAGTLAGLAVTSDGVIYIADSGKSAADGAIWKIGADGKATKIASGASTKRPSAVEINVNRLDKGNGTASATFTTGDASDLVTIDANGKELGRLDLKVGKLAGLAATDNGFFLVQGTDGSTYNVDVYGKPTKLADASAGGTSITWDYVRNKVAVAQPTAGSVTIVAGPRVAGF
jgi:hypothetical protein